MVPRIARRSLARDVLFRDPTGRPRFRLGSTGTPPASTSGVHNAAIATQREVLTAREGKPHSNKPHSNKARGHRVHKPHSQDRGGGGEPQVLERDTHVPFPVPASTPCPSFPAPGIMSGALAVTAVTAVTAVAFPTLDPPLSPT